jgi:ATP-dependent RNA helicase DDX27
MKLSSSCHSVHFDDGSDSEIIEEDTSQNGTMNEDNVTNSTLVSNPEDEVLSFHELNLSRPVLKAVSLLGYVKPTKIQVATIPVALSGKDLLGGATTGSGKHTHNSLFFPKKECTIL